MVKIKDGYVMSPKEQAEFDRQNALPRRASGKVDYYFKPENKYPARVYVFMQAELWCDRNRRPMGLQNAFPFLSRPMNKEELEYHHFNWRLCYHQYESWERLLFAEQREADELDREDPGSGTAFIEKLKTFHDRYRLGGDSIIASRPHSSAPAQGIPPVIDIALQGNISTVLKRLAALPGNLQPALVGNALDMEQSGQKRKAVIFALRFLCRQAAGEIKPEQRLDIPHILKRAEQSMNSSRRNFVRRTYRRSPLFALAEIGMVYPGYAESMLLADLRTKKTKTGRKKHKPVTDLRRCQLQKLALSLMNHDLDAKAFHHTCQTIALYQQAHEEHKPVTLTVKLGGKTMAYDFPWKTRENIIKSFLSLANSKGVDHDQLAARHAEIISSNYSF